MAKRNLKVTRDNYSYMQYTKEILDQEDKVQILIPKLPGDKPNTVEIVSINGYSYSIMKGVAVSVPKSIAENVKGRIEGVHQIDEAVVSESVMTPAGHTDVQKIDDGVAKV